MSSSELHLLYVLGTISLMLGLTERPVMGPYAIAIEYADQHISVLRLPMDAPILAGFQRPCQRLPVFAVGIISDRQCDQEKQGRIGKARRDPSGGPQ